MLQRLEFQNKSMLIYHREPKWNWVSEQSEFQKREIHMQNLTDIYSIAVSKSQALECIKMMLTINSWL